MRPHTVAETNASSLSVPDSPGVCQGTTQLPCAMPTSPCRDESMHLSELNRFIQRSIQQAFGSTSFIDLSRTLSDLELQGRILISYAHPVNPVQLKSSSHASLEIIGQRFAATVQQARNHLQMQAGVLNAATAKRYLRGSPEHKIPQASWHSLSSKFLARRKVSAETEHSLGKVLGSSSSRMRSLTWGAIIHIGVGNSKASFSCCRSWPAAAAAGRLCCF